MAGGIAYDPYKLRQLVLYIADRSIDDSRFGKTKLNKILFFADFTAFQLLGHSVTGAQYQHLPNGPGPHQMLPILNGLQSDGAILIRGEETFVGIQQRVVPVWDPDPTAFLPEEVAIIDRVVDVLRPLTNFEVSELSHQTVAWRLTTNYQEIPYGAAVFSTSEPSEDDLLWLKEVASSGVVEST